MIKIGRLKDAATTLMAYPGFGCLGQDGKWHIHLSGVAWQEPIVITMRQRMIIRMLGGVMKVSPEELKSETFQNRITPFMAEADQRQAVIAELNGRSYRLRKKTKKNGHFRDVLTLSPTEVEQAADYDDFGNRVLQFLVTADHEKSNQASGLIYLLDNHGTSIVSDIDDTIKHSAVGDRVELLTNTFLRDFQSIEGMAEVYRQWSEQGASFHYVSSSPWQLFESLHQMNVMDQFPAGTMHLRNFRLRDQLLKKVIIRRHGKTTAIRFLLKHLPDRRFVLIGDSGEKDPEIYRKICRKFPGRVKALLIRDIQQRPLEEERSRKLQAAIPDGLFRKFQSAEELCSLANELF